LLAQGAAAVELLIPLGAHKLVERVDLVVEEEHMGVVVVAVV
jgi:hypothetical protein